LEAITIARTSLETHVIGAPPTLLPTVLLFHGRLQRLVTLRRDAALLQPETKTDTQVDTQVETGNVYIDSTISALSSTIVRSISGGGHDHLLLRAALLELCSLYGSQLIPNLAEEHKRKASYYLRRAADANTMYQTLRSDVQDIARYVFKN
jgi:hypothetical protein